MGCFNVSGCNTQLGPQAPAIHNDGFVTNEQPYLLLMLGLVTLLMWENSDHVEAIQYLLAQGDGSHTELPFVSVVQVRSQFIYEGFSNEGKSSQN